MALDGQTGDALDDVHMEIRPAAGNATRTRFEARTDHHGRYSLVGLDAGDYWLSAYKLGYDLVDQQMQVSDSLLDVTIRLMPTDGIVVTVRDAVTRSPLRQIYIAGKVDQADGNLLEMVLDDLGAARLPPAFRGRTLVVWSRGYQVAEVAHWNGAALDLYLSPDGG